jgi:hypothetical protein
MADDSGASGMLGVIVGALLVLMVLGGGFYIYSQGGGSAKAPSVTIGVGK